MNIQLEVNDLKRDRELVEEDMPPYDEEAMGASLQKLNNECGEVERWKRNYFLTNRKQKMNKIEG